mmetsp:Transcript_10277/g.39944  ORF Transcript_10277/g.39944 Transcript_10277/m.39944 type:complete len:369 (+) Transcript_10277:497-1603(+)
MAGRRLRAAVPRAGPAVRRLHGLWPRRCAGGGACRGRGKVNGGGGSSGGSCSGSGSRNNGQERRPSLRVLGAGHGGDALGNRAKAQRLAGDGGSRRQRGGRRFWWCSGFGQPQRQRRKQRRKQRPGQEKRLLPSAEQRSGVLRGDGGDGSRWRVRCGPKRRRALRAGLPVARRRFRPAARPGGPRRRNLLRCGGARACWGAAWAPSRRAASLRGGAATPSGPCAAAPGFLALEAPHGRGRFRRPACTWGRRLLQLVAWRLPANGAGRRRGRPGRQCCSRRATAHLAIALSGELYAPRAGPCPRWLWQEPRIRRRPAALCVRAGGAGALQEGAQGARAGTSVCQHWPAGKRGDERRNSGGARVRGWRSA